MTLWDRCRRAAPLGETPLCLGCLRAPAEVASPSREASGPSEGSDRPVADCARSHSPQAQVCHMSLGRSTFGTKSVPVIVGGDCKFGFGALLPASGRKASSADMHAIVWVCVMACGVCCDPLFFGCSGCAPRISSWTLRAGSLYCCCSPSAPQAGGHSHAWGVGVRLVRPIGRWPFAL